MPKIDRILSDPSFFWRAKRQGCQKGRDVLFLRMQRESGIIPGGIGLGSRGCWLKKRMSSGKSADLSCCRQLWESLPIIVGRLADNHQQAYRQLSKGKYIGQKSGRDHDIQAIETR